MGAHIRNGPSDHKRSGESAGVRGGAIIRSRGSGSRKGRVGSGLREVHYPGLF